MDIDKNAVGGRIKNIRLEHGYSLKDFGIKIGEYLNSSRVKEGIISRWENGVSLPNNERLKVIANIGEITVEELLNGDIEEYVLTKLVAMHDIENPSYKSTVYNETYNYKTIYEGMDGGGNDPNHSAKEVEAIIDDFLPRIVPTLVSDFNISFDDTDQTIISKYQRLLENLKEGSLTTYESITNYLYHQIFSILDKNESIDIDIDLEEHLKDLAESTNQAADIKDLINKYYINNLLYKLADDLSESNLNYVKAMERRNLWSTDEDGNQHSNY